MAFKDMTVILYDGTIKIDYKDKIHRYYARPRKLDANGQFLFPEDNPKAWDKVIYPKGVTTMLGDTLEKKGLLKYALTKALMDLYGFYEFTDDAGEKKMGYSKKGTARMFGEDGKLIPYTKEEAMEHISYGSKASDRHTMKGADIGSVVHDAIEHYVKNQPFNISEDYKNSIDAAEYETEANKTQAYEEFDSDVAMAEAAFARFVEWWTTTKPELLGAEDLIYSKKYNISGTFDGLLRIEGKGVVLCDWKTSNASQSESARMPEGINYQYFIQSAMYAMAWQEMGRDHIDDLLIVSCRKDGGFTALYASDLGLTVDDCINWVKAVIVCMKMMNKTKDELWAHGIATGAVVPKVKKGAKK